MFVRYGKACQKAAAIPAIIGPENDVPLLRPTCPFGKTTAARKPWALTSGLILPSTVGPKELKLALKPSESTAPTASTESPSAGAPIKCQGSSPSLPAEFTTSIPVAAAKSAALVIIVVFPSRSAYV